MNYSNGFDLDAVLPAIQGRVRWRSDSPSARTFESFHALCTEQNLRDVQPVANISDSDFSAYKTTIQNDIIKRCLSSVFSEPERIEQVLLHNRIENSPNQPIHNTGLFCGIRINVAVGSDISQWIKNVTLLFDGAATFNLYLFKQGTPAPIKTVSVTSVANTPTVVNLTNWILSYAKEQAYVFYIGYFQDDLGSVKALRENVCMNPSKCFGATYCEASKTAVATINQDQVAYTSSPYGLTAEVHSFRDYTQVIVRNPELFDEVIGLSMEYYILEQIVASTRSNSTERVLLGNYEAIEIKHYLYGALPAMGVAKTTGLNEIIAQKFQSVRRSFYPMPQAQTVSLW